MSEPSFVPPGIPTVPPAEAQRRVEQGAVLVDVREIDEYAQVRIPGAQLMPLSSLAETFRELPSDRDVILYCRSGARSANATQALVAQIGLDNVFNLDGGIIEWYEQGLPVSTDHVTIPERFLPFDVAHPELAAKALDSGELRWVVDVRPAEQFATGHVPTARNIPFSQLPLRHTELPRGEPLLVTCDRGELSTMAAKLLVDLDFQHVSVVDGGLEAWRYHDLPLVSGS